jgi:hypothetical protein
LKEKKRRGVMVVPGKCICLCSLGGTKFVAKELKQQLEGSLPQKTNYIIKV